MTTLLLFDFDDTLVVTERHMVKAYHENLGKLLAPYYKAESHEQLMVKNVELYRLYGSAQHGWMHELGLGMDFTLEMFRQLAPLLLDSVQPHVARDEHLLQHLRMLKAQGHTMAILTLGHRDYCLPMLEMLGLDKIFPQEMVFDISVMEGKLKRDVATYEHLLKQHLSQKFERKIMFEDSLRNLMAAHKAGFETVLVGGKHPPEELDSSIDHHFATVVEALESGKLGL